MKNPMNQKITVSACLAVSSSPSTGRTAKAIPENVHSVVPTETSMTASTYLVTHSEDWVFRGPCFIFQVLVFGRSMIFNKYMSSILDLNVPRCPQNGNLKGLVG